ncbi:DoxX family membrane protein [Candidatus Woesearchaeota archaeon]|nr:DoxX family membrane protein [Candidatus Woesearchaeota archaeon]
MINQKFKLDKYGPLVLRLGLAIVLLWFGINEVLNPLLMAGYIPNWFTNLSPISINSFMILNGSFEILLGILLVLGLFTRIAAILTTLHLLFIIIALGYNEIAIRDFGLFMAALSLSLTKECYLSLDNLRKK